jgi:GNAT superfamily N-acetyltransferase
MGFPSNIVLEETATRIQCCAGLLLETQSVIRRSPLNDVVLPHPGRFSVTLQIRDAVRADAEIILGFITELAIYEKAEHEVLASVADIQRSLFDDPDSPARALICLLDDEPIGFAVHFFSYSTWLGCKGLYLEDLYVSQQHRGVGAGKALLRHLAKIAVDSGCGRFEWSVLDWNQPAIDFYLSIGAEPQAEWVKYRMEGENLADFASGKR